MDILPQDVISKDNISVKVNAVLYFKAIDPEKAIIQVENLMLEFAKELNIPVYGSYNPSHYNCNNFYFYDGMHPVKDCLDKILVEADLIPRLK